MLWLLEESVLAAMRLGVAAGVFSSEKQVEYETRMAIDSESGPRLLTRAGASAEIPVTGVITAKPDFMAMLFGGGNTTYGEITAALAAADQDPEIKDITMRIDSPGGQFDGLFDTLAAMQATTKPITAQVVNKASSAAYAIASQADKIIAQNKATRFGSVGVVVGFRVNESIVEITSTEAPKKRPDVTSEAGRAVVREELDPMHTLFAEAIAEGRGTTVEKINANYGQGAVLLAEDALQRGMIDGIAGSPLKTVKKPAAASRGTQTKDKAMDLNTLKAQHPDVHAAAVQQGVAQERDRISAHMTMGEASGDMATAKAAINDGSAMTSALQATYMAASMNKAATATRQTEDVEAGAALTDAAGTVEEQEATAGQNILLAAAESCGVTVGGK